MSKPLIFSLPLLLLISCADTSDRYRDTHQLELPPVLPIEHTHIQPALSKYDMKPKGTSPLENLVDFTDDEKMPVLTLKTRPERAWEMIVVALKISNVEVVDKNREENRIQVRFDPDIGDRESGFLNIFAANDYPEAEYTISMKEDIVGIAVNANPSKPEQLDAGEDGSAELIRLLNKTIDEQIIHRDRNRPEQ